MCGVWTNQVFPASQKWHPLLMEALSGIPDVKADDSVCWHCDLIHSVAPIEDQKGWGNVMYIPAAPGCPRNEAYSENVRDAFLTGSSPSDFPDENYEREWAGDLEEVGVGQIRHDGADIAQAAECQSPRRAVCPRGKTRQTGPDRLTA